MTAIPWASTGLDHRPRVVLPIAGPDAETCMKHPDEPVSSEYADQSWCQGCGDDASHAIEQARRELGWEMGLDVQPGTPHVRFPFPTTTHEDI